MYDKLAYLLLQIRDPDDPMRRSEVISFARSLKCDSQQIRVCDLLTTAPSRGQLDAADMILLGGSGNYSAAGAGPWLERTLDVLRGICEESKPTFASCWGFQALARALGGRVLHDLQRAELGTQQLTLTEAGRNDPVFGGLDDVFYGHAGHEDFVDVLPACAVLLASSAKVQNQAYRVEGKPIYSTQFHPELNCADLLARVRVYPQYMERISGLPLERFDELCQETPETEALLLRMVDHVFG